jgi:Cop9 signalosome subunit 5 C-terminal domain
MQDLTSKIQKTTSQNFTSSAPSSDLDGMVMTPTKQRVGRGRKNVSGKFDKIIADSERISGEEVHGLLTQVLKDRLFNGVR